MAFDNRAKVLGHNAFFIHRQTPAQGSDQHPTSTFLAMEWERNDYNPVTRLVQVRALQSSIIEL